MAGKPVNYYQRFWQSFFLLLFNLACLFILGWAVYIEFLKVNLKAPPYMYPFIVVLLILMTSMLLVSLAGIRKVWLLLHDIKKQNQLPLVPDESSQQLYSVVSENLDYPLSVIDQDFKIVYINGAYSDYCRQFGVVNPIHGHKLHEALSFISSAVIDEYQMVFRTGKVLVTEEEVSLSNHLVVNEVRKIPVIIDGDVKQIITVIRNLTLDRLTEKEHEIYYRLSQMLPATQTVRELALLIAGECRYIFKHDFFSFDLYDPENLMLEGVFLEDTPVDQSVPVELEPENVKDVNNTAGVLLEKKSLLVNRKELPSNTLLVPAGFTERKSMSFMFLPILWQGQIVAIVTVQSYTPQRYQDHDLEIFKNIVNQCAGTLGKILTEHRLRQLNLNWEKKVQDRTAALSKTNALLVKEVQERGQIQDVLRDNQKKLEILLDNLPGMVYRCANDECWTVEYISDAVNSIVGYSPDDLIHNKTISLGDLIHPDDRSLVWKTIQESIKLKKSFEIEHRLHRKDGADIHVRNWGHVINTETSTELVFIEGFIQNIEPEIQKESKIRESENLYRNLVENVKEWVWEIDQADKYIYVSPQVKNYLGYEPDDLINKTPFDLIKPEQHDQIKGVFYRYRLSLEPFNFLEYPMIHKDGHIVYMETSGSPVFDASGQYKGYRGVVRDITEKQRTETQLRANDVRQTQQREVLMQLATLHLVGDVNLNQVYNLVTELSCSALQVDWVSLWEFDEENDVLVLQDRFDMKTTIHYEMDKLLKNEFPVMWGALYNNRSLVVSNVFNSDYTVPFVDSYYRKYNVSSIMIAPIRVGGGLKGVLCFEQKETHRRWELDEEAFAASISDMIALAIDQHIQQENQRRLEELTIQIEAQAKQLDEILSASPDMLALFNEDGQIKYVNKVATAIIGVEKEHATGKNLFELQFSEDVYQKHQNQVKQVFKTSLPLQDVMLLPTVTGGRWFEYILSPIRDLNGVVQSVVMSARDITHRLNIENELRRSLDELNAANKELEAFNYSVSHDLRVPLQVISGFSNLMLNHENRLSVDDKEAVHAIDRNAKRMSQLITDLLSFSRLGRQEMKCEVINMQELVDSIVQVHYEANPDRKIEFISHGLPMAYGDKIMITRVLDNLLGNSFKYSRFKEQALIEVGGWEEAGRCVFYVKDNGIGFDMQNAENLFNPFQRLTNSSGFEGTGVGLAIVARVMDRHHGSVWCDSKPDQGSVFYFALPNQSNEIPQV